MSPRLRWAVFCARTLRWEEPSHLLLALVGMDLREGFLIPDVPFLTMVRTPTPSSPADVNEVVVKRSLWSHATLQLVEAIGEDFVFLTEGLFGLRPNNNPSRDWFILMGQS